MHQRHVRDEIRLREVVVVGEELWTAELTLVPAPRELLQYMSVSSALSAF